MTIVQDKQRVREEIWSRLEKSTVHPLQLLDHALPTTGHDFFVDLIATPVEVVRSRHRSRRQPRGILPGHLTEEIRRSVPVLRDLAP